MILFLLFINSVISHIAMRNPTRKTRDSIILYKWDGGETSEMPPQKQVGRQIKHMALQNRFFEMGNGDIKLGRGAEVMN